MPSADPLRDWHLLGRSLELGEGFSYYLVFTNWPEQNQEGKALLNEALQARGLSLQVVAPDDPEKLVETTVAALFRDDLPPATPLWLECWRNGSDPAWNLARRRLMARLNEGRGRLEKEVLRPLILLLPRDGVLRAAEDAPDMWSIRKLVVHMERPVVAGGATEPLFVQWLEHPPMPGQLARAERRLAAWQKQWDKAEVSGVMQTLSLWDAWDATDALLEAGWLKDAETVAVQALQVSQLCRNEAQPDTLIRYSVSLDKVGDVSLALGNLDAARASWEESLAIKQCFKDEVGEAKVLYRLGGVLHDQGHLDAARQIFSRTLDIQRRLMDRFGEVSALNGMGLVLRDQGSLEEARKAFEDCLVILQQLNSSHGAALVLSNLGGVLHREGHMEEALVAHKKALSLLRVTLGEGPEAFLDMSFSLKNIGQIYRDLGDLNEARAAFHEAADLAARLVALQLDNPGYQKLQTQLLAELDKLPP